MPRHHQAVFYDSTRPYQIPADSLAAVYVNRDGSYAWTQPEVNRMRGVFGISESGDPKWARYARCIAVEVGAASVQDCVPFLVHRQRLGHLDGMCYVNQSEWEDVERTVSAAGFVPDWWVAAPGIADPGALRSPVHDRQPVAVQTFWGDAWDRSVILGDLAFTPPHQFTATR